MTWLTVLRLKLAMRAVSRTTKQATESVLMLTRVVDSYREQEESKAKKKSKGIAPVG